jgi:hypothetical protein
MAVLVKFVSDYASWFYGICAVLALLLLRLTVKARLERLQAIFTLERESAVKREVQLLWGAIGLLVLLGSLFSLQHYVGPAIIIPGSQPQATPTVLLLVTPSSTMVLTTPTLTPTVTPTRGRPTRPPQSPTPTDTPAAVVPAPSGRCSNPGAQLTSPGNSQPVRGLVQFTGTANVANFDYYKVEFGAGTSPQEWHFLFLARTTVVNGTLGSWDSSAVPPGTYTFRLVVVDRTGNYPPPCQVTVAVER